MPGLRGEYDLLIEDYIVDPRITARFELLKDETAIKAGVGLFSQRPSPDESDKDFGDPDIDFERAVHVSVGVEQKLTEFLEIDVVSFYKHPQLDSSRYAVGYRRCVRGGARAAFGEQRDGPFIWPRTAVSSCTFGAFFWMVKLYVDAFRATSGRRGSCRPFDFDQTHVLTVLGQYKLTNTWEVGAISIQYRSSADTVYRLGL